MLAVTSATQKSNFHAVVVCRLHPKKALQDFSVSLLIDDSDENVLAYLHRGILYNDIGKSVQRHRLLLPFVPQ